MYMDKIEQLMDCEEFVQKLNMTNGVEEMQELFVQHGVDIPMEELGRMIATASVGENGELNEDALDNVAGGLLKKFWDWLCGKNTEGINDVVNIACGKNKK